MTGPQLVVSWHSFDLRSGRRGQKVDTQGSGNFSRIIGESTDTTLGVLIWQTENERQIPGVISATDPGRTMLVALDQDERILWGGIVLRRNSNASMWATVQAATLEHYLDRRYAGDLVYETTDQVTIAAGVINGLDVDGLDGLVVDAPPSGVLRDFASLDTDDKTMLSVLQDLHGLDNGVEFTIDLEWADAEHTALTRILRLRQRIGTAATAPVQFTLPGAVDDFDYVEDYSADFGATDVMATSSGEGAARPASTHHVDTAMLANGWARFERRFQPASSTSDEALLDSAATEELREVHFGLRDFSLTARLDAAPVVGVDFHLGDDVTAVFTCPRFPAYFDADNRLQPGFSETVRCVGWAIDADARTFAPQLRQAA